MSFNPRTHMGCDPYRMRVGEGHPCFNPRTHMGCDTSRELKLWQLLSFNPRTHMGCDRIFSKRLNITLQKYIICEEKQKE